MSGQTLKDLITEFVVISIQKLGITDVIPQVTRPENPEHGEYTTNVCLVLAKQTKQNPLDIAKKLQEAIIQHQKESKTELVKLIEIAPPGFVNLFLSEAKLISQIEGLLKDKEKGILGKKGTLEGGNAYKQSASGNPHLTGLRSEAASHGSKKKIDKQKHHGTVADSQKGLHTNLKRVVVEFTDPNPFKEFHIGHLYSNAVGESLSRLLEATGHTVRRVNYFGDVGMHTAKALYGLLQIPNIKSQIPNYEKKPLAERVKILGEAYAKGATAYEDTSAYGEKAREEMKELNYYIYIAAQELHKKTKGWQPQVNYRQYIRVDEAKLKDVRDVYEKGRQWSLDYFETIYDRLGTAFDGYYPESVVGEYGAKLVREHTKGGVFEKSDGAIIFRGEKEGLHTRVFINSLGLPTYEAKELGLAPAKYEDWPYDRSIIVTGNEINEYFKVLIAAMGRINPELGAKTRHIGHGMVRLPSGKMSSRTGHVLTGEALIEEVKEKIFELLEHNKSKYSVSEKDTIAEKAAIAAIKYSLLKVSLPSDITFDIDKSVNFDGDSGPYLQYTYARCMSVLRKNVQKGESTGEDYKRYIYDTVKSTQKISLRTEEKDLLRLLNYFPEIVAEAATNLTPNILCTYLFTLAQEFNLFYAKEPILGNPLRLAVTAATAGVLKKGLHLLGIETLERM